MVKQSIIDPLESIHMSVGSHIFQVTEQRIELQGLEGRYERITPTVLLLEKDTILRSKEIKLHSFDTNAQIECKGLVQSTGGDIVVDAKGDVHIHKVVASQNLNITAIGKVIFYDRVLVGGELKIQAADVEMHGEIIVQNRVTINTNNATMNGILTCRDDATIIARNITHTNTLTVDKDLWLNADIVHNQGTVIVLGNFTPGARFHNNATGCVDLAKAPAAFEMLVSNNHGKIEVRESVDRTVSTLTTGTGSICIHGVFRLIGDQFTNNGDIEALSGIYLGMKDNVFNNRYLRTFCDLNIRANRLKNSKSSRIFAFGLVNFLLVNDYIDDGHVYSPTLCSIEVSGTNGMMGSINLGSNYYFEGGQARFQPNSFTTILSGANFLVKQHITFATGAECNHHGYVKQSQGFEFKYESYYPTAPQQPINRAACNGVVASVPQRNFQAYRDAEQRIRRCRRSAIVYSVRNDLRRYGLPDTADCGSVEYLVGGELRQKSVVKSGVFKDDDIRIQAQSAHIAMTEFSTLGAFTMTIDDLLVLRNVSVDAGGAVAINAATALVDLQDAHMQSRDHIRIIADQLTTQNVIVRTPTSVYVIARQADLRDTTVASAEYDIQVAEKATVANSTFNGTGVIRAGELHGKDTRFIQDAYLDVQGILALEGVDAFEQLTATAKEIILKGLNRAAELALKAPVIVNTGGVTASRRVLVSADHLQQFGALCSCGELIIETERLEDTMRSRLEANIVRLMADQFRGKIDAEEAATVELSENMPLQALLDQIKTEMLTASLPDEVMIEQDLNVAYTLNLLAKRFENKAKLTANKDLIVHVQEDILNSGVITGTGRLGFFAERGTFTNMGAVGAGEGLDVKALAIQNGVLVKSKADVQYNQEARLH